MIIPAAATAFPPKKEEWWKRCFDRPETEVTFCEAYKA